ncbi:MAG TPA: GNAT family N-acetyltransferase [Candidatus Eisenbacteria bacterium]
MNDLRTSIVADGEGFRRLGPEWDALLDRSRSGSVFLAWGWLYAWWCHLAGDRELRLVTVRDERGALIGIAPFCIQREGTLPRLRVLTFLGRERVSSEYLDVIAEPGREEAICRAVWGALLDSRPDWDFLRFPDMTESAGLLRSLDGLADSRAFAKQNLPAEICPYLPLAPTRDAFHEAIGGSLRRRARQLARYLEQAGATVRTVDAPDELPSTLETLFRLHARRWSTRRQTGNFEDGRVRAFHFQVASVLGPRGAVRLYVMTRAQEPIAALYALQYKDTLFFYQSGFEPRAERLGLKPHEYSPGFVLVYHSMLDAVDRGLRSFDFLRGPEEYKSRWTKEARVTRCLTIVPRANVAALGRHHWGRAVALSKRTVKRLLGRTPAPEWGRS